MTPVHHHTIATNEGGREGGEGGREGREGKEGGRGGGITSIRAAQSGVGFGPQRVRPWKT